MENKNVFFWPKLVREGEKLIYTWQPACKCVGVYVCLCGGLWFFGCEWCIVMFCFLFFLQGHIPEKAQAALDFKCNHLSQKWILGKHTHRQKRNISIPPHLHAHTLSTLKSFHLQNSFCVDTIIQNFSFGSFRPSKKLNPSRFFGDLSTLPVNPSK